MKIIKERRLLAECSQFLSGVSPAEAKQEIIKPFPESSLHEMTFDELKTNLYEARRTQHLIPQFSSTESKHFQFIDEATAILSYKQLDELNKSTLGSYIKKSADSGMENSFKAGANAVAGKPEDQKKNSEKSLNRFKGILRATAKLTKEEVEPLDELSRATLNAYSGKSTEEVSGYEKSHDAKMSTIAKRIKGVLAARKKLKTKNKENVMDESEQLDELSKTTLGSYIDKASEKSVKDRATQIHSRIDAYRARDRAIEHPQKSYMRGSKEAEAKQYDKRSEKADFDSKKHLEGIKKATTRLVKEEEEVDHSNRQLFEDAAAAAETDARYKIVRMYNKGERGHTIKRGLSLADAQAHCANPETSSMTASLKSNIERTQRMGHWFDGYDYDKK